MEQRRTTAEIISRLEQSGDLEAAHKLRVMHQRYKYWKREAKKANVRWMQAELKVLRVKSLNQVS